MQIARGGSAGVKAGQGESVGGYRRAGGCREERFRSGFGRGEVKARGSAEAAGN